jgi:hypothetical protein
MKYVVTFICIEMQLQTMLRYSYIYEMIFIL